MVCCAHSAWGEQILGQIQLNEIAWQLGPCSVPECCVVGFYFPVLMYINGPLRLESLI